MDERIDLSMSDPDLVPLLIQVLFFLGLLKILYYMVINWSLQNLPWAVFFFFFFEFAWEYNLLVSSFLTPICALNSRVVPKSLRSIVVRTITCHVQFYKKCNCQNDHQESCIVISIG